MPDTERELLRDHQARTVPVVPAWLALPLGVALMAGGVALVLVGAGALPVVPRSDVPPAVPYSVGVVFVVVGAWLIAVKLGDGLRRARARRLRRSLPRAPCGSRITPGARSRFGASRSATRRARGTNRRGRRATSSTPIASRSTRHGGEWPASGTCRSPSCSRRLRSKRACRLAPHATGSWRSTERARASTSTRRSSCPSTPQRPPQTHALDELDGLGVAPALLLTVPGAQGVMRWDSRARAGDSVRIRRSLQAAAIPRSRRR